MSATSRMAAVQILRNCHNIRYTLAIEFQSEPGAHGSASTVSAASHQLSHSLAGVVHAMMHPGHLLLPPIAPTISCPVLSAFHQTLHSIKGSDSLSLYVGQRERGREKVYQLFLLNVHSICPHNPANARVISEGSVCQGRIVGGPTRLGHQNLILCSPC